MELVFMALLIVLTIVALDVIVWRYGADSRLTIDDDKGQQSGHRWI